MFILVSGTVFLYSKRHSWNLHTSNLDVYWAWRASTWQTSTCQGICSLLVGEIKDFVSALASSIPGYMHRKNTFRGCVFWSIFFGWTFHHPNIDPNGRSWISWWITKDYWFWIETSSTLDRTKTLISCRGAGVYEHHVFQTFKLAQPHLMITVQPTHLCTWPL